MKDYWKVPATVFAVIALAACSANGGFPGGSRGGGGGNVDCEATPEDPACQMDENPDISNWEATRRGANSALFETGLVCDVPLLQSCTVPAEGDNASYDGDAETSSTLSYNFAGLSDLTGDAVITATFDTGLINAQGNNVAAVELDAATTLGSGATLTVATAIGGTPTEDPAADSASNAVSGSFSGSTGTVLVGFQNTLPYDQIILTITVSGGNLADEFTLFDVVTAATAPPEDTSGDAAQ